ncbi:MAG: hypothetical protein ACK4WH_14300 [Phycisphaerales bacterium]
MSTPRFMAVLVALAALVFGVVRAALLSGERNARLDAARLAEPTPEAPAPPAPVAHIARTLRTLKIVTVEIHTIVESRRLDQSWRGDVSATVAAPVRLLYGCDLSAVVNGPEHGPSVRRDPLTGGVTLRVPRPTRIAVEVEGDRQTHDVSVGWGRFRDISGEFQLGLARAGVYERARSMRPTPQQVREVERLTREQLTALVRGLAARGDDLPVTIEFVSQESPGLAGVASDAPPFSGPGDAP